MSSYLESVHDPNQIAARLLAFIDHLLRSGSRESRPERSADPKKALDRALEAHEKVFEAGSGQEIENFWILYCTLLVNLPPKDRAPYSTQMLAAIMSTATSKNPEVGLGLLNHIYTLNLGENWQFSVLESVLQYALKAAQESLLQSAVLPTLVARIKSASLNAAQSRHIFELVLDQLIASPVDNSAALRTYLESFESDRFDTAESAVSRILTAEIASSSIRPLDTLLAIPVVQHYKQTPLFALAQIVAEQDLAALNTFLATSDGACLKTIDLEKLKTKMRLLTLNLLVVNATRDVLTYAEIAKHLDINEDEVEEWTIAAVAAKAIDVRLNQVSKTVTLRHAELRHVNAQTWQTLEKRLTETQGTLQNILGVITEVRSRSQQ